MKTTQIELATSELNSQEDAYPYLCTKEYLKTAHIYYGIFVPIICLGLPGNVLVILIYMYRLTSSTRIYMFAVAIADTTVLLAFIVRGVFNLILFDNKSFLICNIARAPLFVMSLALVYTCCILSYVAVERCLAVVKSNTFRLEAKRAKRFCVVAVGHTFLQAGVYIIYGWTDDNRSGLLRFLVVIVFTIPPIAILVSYSMMIAFLKKCKNKVGTTRQHAWHEPETTAVTSDNETVLHSDINSSHIRPDNRNMNDVIMNQESPTERRMEKNVPTIEITTCADPVNISTERVTRGVLPSMSNERAHSSTPNIKSEQIDLPQKHNTLAINVGSAQEIKVVQKLKKRTSFDRVAYMLVLVTASFLLLWIPACVSTLGLTLPDYLRDSFLINSVINPFIYSFMSAEFRQYVKELRRKIEKRGARIAHWWRG